MRVAIYFNHYHTLGHATRVLALVRAVRRDIPHSKVLILESGRTPGILLLGRYAKVVRLPYMLDKRGFFIEQSVAIYGRIITSPGVRRMMELRLKKMREALARFRPDVFITENFPFGQEFWTFELPPLLAYVREDLECKVVGSCGYLSYTENMIEYVKKFYDRILIHTPRRLALGHLKHFRKTTAHVISQALKDFSNKIDFTGFIFEKPAVGKKEIISKKKGFSRLIFVSRGGGIVDREIILSAILAARKKTEYFFVVCCGPSTGAEEMRAYKKLAAGAKNVRIFRALSPENFDRWMAAADVCVTMGGYNTCLKLLFFRKRAVVVPFSTTEQQGRAEMMRGYLPVRIVSDRTVSPARLRRAIDDVLRMPSPSGRMPGGFFNGARETTRILRCLL